MGAEGRAHAIGAAIRLALAGGLLDPDELLVAVATSVSPPPGAEEVQARLGALLRLRLIECTRVGGGAGAVYRLSARGRALAAATSHGASRPVEDP